MDVNLPVNVEFSIHAASLAIQSLDRVELEEAFIELLHQKALDRQMFYDIMKIMALMPTYNSSSLLKGKFLKEHGYTNN